MTTKKIDTAIILAGGKGTRLSEQTKIIPKPLVKVGPDPAIFHIIRHFVKYGVTNIYIAGGYKVDMIIDTFKHKLNFNNNNGNDNLKIYSNENDLLYKANIHIIDTGYSTDTAQRIKRTLEYLPEDNKETFITYGDTFSDVNLDNVTSTLFSSDTNVVALTAATFQERFGIMTIDGNNHVTKFAEKSQSTDEFINGGYMACSKALASHIEPTDSDFSKDTLPRLQEQGHVSAYVHRGFWFPMDSQRDYEQVNKIYNQDPDGFLK